MRMKRSSLISGATHDEEQKVRLREKAKEKFGSEPDYIYSRDSAVSQETRRQVLNGRILPSPSTIVVMLELGFSKDEVAELLRSRGDTLWADIISTEPGLPLTRESGETVKDFETINFPERTYMANLVKALARLPRLARAVPGNTPLHLLALGQPSNEKEQADIIEAVKMLTKNNRFDINAQNEEGKTPLMYSCEVQNEKLALWFLDHTKESKELKSPVDPTIRDKQNRTVVSYASGQMAIMQKLKTDHPDLVTEAWMEGVIG